MRTGRRPQVMVGEMNREITLRTSTRVRRPSGGYTVTTTDGPTVWASVTPLEGREQLVAMQSGIQRPHRFEFRYDPALNLSAVTQIVYEGRLFDVKSAIDIEESHELFSVLAEELEEEED